MARPAASSALSPRRARPSPCPASGSPSRGPIAGALAGAGAGGAAGSLLGALVGLGIPEDRAKAYRDDVKNGSIVVAAHPRDDKDRDYLRDEFGKYNASNLHY